MKKIFVIASGLFLASCAEEKPTVVPNPTSVTTVNFPRSTVHRFCDRNRAIYVLNGPQGDAIAVVPHAIECP